MKRLLDVLREDCGLTGTKEGCGEGECGACTVLIDGVAVDSCIVPVAHADGPRADDHRGRGRGERTARRCKTRSCVHGGAQCGICTPGMILAATVGQARRRLDEIQDALAGNLCRCTGYPAIFRSVESALKTRAHESEPCRPSLARSRSSGRAR